jgi:hypothetical protein
MPREVASDGAAALTWALALLLEEDPAGWSPEQAVVRAEALLRAREQVEVPVLAAVADVDAREAFGLTGHGSARGWLRGLPCGEGGLVARARRWHRHVPVRDAVAAGTLGRRAADQVVEAAEQLDRLDQLGEDQVIGVLAHAVPDLLAVWVGRHLTESDLAAMAPPQVAEITQRRERLIDTLTACADDRVQAPGTRLEPALVLLGEALPPAGLADALGQFVAALQPEVLDEQDERTREAAWIRVVKRADGGWDLSGLLDDVTGARLLAELKRRRQPTPVPPEASPPAQEAWVPAQSLAGALECLLDDLSAVEPGAGAPRPVQLVVVTSDRAWAGVPGTLPAQLQTPIGPVSVAAEVARRLATTATVHRVPVDPHGRPDTPPPDTPPPDTRPPDTRLPDTTPRNGPGPPRRHATTRERRELMAVWGLLCAVEGCTGSGEVPHHVRWWSKGGVTTHDNLVPLCRGCHRDHHEDRRVLRLTDGRWIGPDGWCTGT